MGKRFTDADKYHDKWYRRLPLAMKVGWDYLYHTCDAAGVIDLDDERAAFEIGADVDWEALLAIAGHRIEVLPNGRWWLTGFIAFQYGTLSESCPAHKPIYKLLDKHQLADRVLNRVSNRVFDTLKDKDKEKDKEKDKDKEGGAGGNELDRIESPRLRATASEWLAYKRERREGYKPTGLKGFVSRVLSLVDEHSEADVTAAIQRAMANGWKGFEHGLGDTRGSPTPQKKPRIDFSQFAKEPGT